MENKPNTSTPVLEKKRKDYLYRIAKMRENNMLCDKDSDHREYAHQGNLTSTQNNQNQLDDDCQFELKLPQHRPQIVNKITVENQLKMKANVAQFKNLSSPTITNQSKDQQSIKPLKQSTQINKKVDQPTKNSIQQKAKTKSTIPKQFQFLKFDEDQFNEPEQHKPQEVVPTLNAPVLETPPVLTRNWNSSSRARSNHSSRFQATQKQKRQELQQFEEQLDVKQVKQQNEEKIDNQEEIEKEQEDQEEEQDDIKGVTILSNSMDGNIVIKITNKQQLVLSRLPPGIILKCIIRRSTDIFNPQFDFYLNNGLKHIISAKKYSLAKRQIFKLSLELGKYRDRDIIGSIMANTAHNIYWVYRRALESEEESDKEIKCVVRYQKIVKDVCRQMNVQLFVNDKKQVMIEHSKIGHEISQQHDLTLKNIPLQSKQSSSKNYTLFDNEDKQYKYLKMSKVSDHMFEVEIQHPLSPLQAFAISLTRFDAELK